MSERFFKGPILNSPYECPTRHWELVDGIPTQEIVESRRESRLITPIPQPRKRGGKGEQVQQRSLGIGAQDLSDEKQQYEVTQQINSIRALVEEWRQAPESQWKVSAETAIWLTEVAPEIGKRGKDILEKLGSGNEEANHCYREKPVEAEERKILMKKSIDENRDGNKDRKDSHLWMLDIKSFGREIGKSLDRNEDRLLA